MCCSVSSDYYHKGCFMFTFGTVYTGTGEGSLDSLHLLAVLHLLSMIFQNRILTVISTGVLVFPSRKL